MGEGEEVKTRDESNVEIKERGEIFIVYRPKVNKEEAHSEDDVQRLYIVLRPESKPGDSNPSSSSSSSSSVDDGSRSGGHGAEEVNIQKQTLMRLIVMGRKSLPPTSKKGKGRAHWGFVELVTTDVAQLKSALQPEEYDTSTRGHRRKPAARAMGEGVYRILTHNPSDSSSASNSKMHTHLIYKLHIPGGNISPPTKDDTPQHALNVEPEASFLIQIKNPSPKHARGGGGGFRGVQSKRKATFPATLQGLFGNRGYVPADPPDFLNYEGCELLLISASDDISTELGIELKTDQDVSSQPSDDECCSSFVHTFGEDSGLPTTPLFQRTWA